MAKQDERYHNIFDYYMGPSKDSKADQTKGIENNITKAFLNVLEIGGSQVQTEFLEWLSAKTKHSFELKGEPRFSYIGKRPHKDELRDAKVKLMLGVKPYWRPKYERKTKYKRAEKPQEKPQFDGVIVGGEWVIAIESKRKTGLNKTQFRRERDSLRSRGSRAVSHVIDWRDIYLCFKDLLRKTEDGEKKLEPLSKLLLQQFCSYLESDAIKQVGFQGLENKHFDFMAVENESDDDDIRKELLELMKTLLTDLGDVEYIKQRYIPSSRVTGLRKTRKKRNFVDLDFYSKKRGKSDKRAYIQVSLYDECMQVFVAVEKEALKQLLNRMRKNPTQFEKALPVKDRQYYLDLYHYYGDDPYVQRLPRVIRRKKKYLGVLVSDFVNVRDAIKLLGDRIDELLTSKKDKHLNLALTRSFNRDYVVKRERHIVKEIADTIKELTPLVDFINSRA